MEWCTAYPVGILLYRVTLRYAAYQQYLYTESIGDGYAVVRNFARVRQGAANKPFVKTIQKYLYQFFARKQQQYEASSLPNRGPVLYSHTNRRSKAAAAGPEYCSHARGAGMRSVKRDMLNSCTDSICTRKKFISCPQFCDWSIKTSFRVVYSVDICCLNLRNPNEDTDEGTALRVCLRWTRSLRCCLVFISKYR